MPLMIACDARTCGKPLTNQGGLIFGPRDERGSRRKIHLCDACFMTFRSLIADDRKLIGYERRHPKMYSPPDATGVVMEYDFTEQTFGVMTQMLRR